MSHFDYIVVGSGFGGSVSALRLAEKGYRVAVLEQGRRVSSEEMKKASLSTRTLTWLPKLGLYGFFNQTFFRHVGLIRGVGVGGGSLVYAAVLLKPKSAFYRCNSWSSLADWETELASHYDTAINMLGRARNPHQSEMDRQLKSAAEALGCGDSYGSVPQGIFFGEPDEKVEDPYFGGEGPERVGCNQCGHCISGCHVGAKNSLDKNYLYLAEKAGVEIIPETRVESIHLVEGGGTDGPYRLSARQGLGWRAKDVTFTADKLVLAGGVVGSLELLFQSRDETASLPKISKYLGNKVRTNSEALVASLAKDRALDLSRGTTISSDFYFGEDTHITQNRIPPSQAFMRFYMGPMVDDPVPLRRALKTLWRLLRSPITSTVAWRARDWGKRATVLTVMQVVDNALKIRFKRSPLWPFSRRLVTQVGKGERVPSFLAKANQAARTLAEVSDGVPLNIMAESVGNLAMTAHILGGCPIGGDDTTGVVDSAHRLFNYSGIRVVDASVIPANVGVNPSLTITAMAERCMSLIPHKDSLPD